MLRNRFGINQRQAKDLIRHLRRQPRQSIHELGIEAQRLTRLAYPKLPESDQEEMALEAFLQALDNKAVKRHLLATPAATVTEAAQKANAYLQVGDNSYSSVSTIQDEVPTTPPVEDPVQKALAQIQTVLAQQAQLIQHLATQPSNTPQVLPHPRKHPSDATNAEDLTLSGYAHGYKPHPPRLRETDKVQPDSRPRIGWTQTHQRAPKAPAHRCPTYTRGVFKFRYRPTHVPLCTW